MDRWRRWGCVKFGLKVCSKDGDVRETLSESRGRGAGGALLGTKDEFLHRLTLSSLV